MDQCGTHIIGIELSFLEKLGWLLKEAKRLHIGRPRASHKGQQKTTLIHMVFTIQGNKIGWTINATLKNETRLNKRKQNKTQKHPP